MLWFSVCVGWVVWRGFECMVMCCELGGWVGCSLACFGGLPFFSGVFKVGWALSFGVCGVI